MSNHTAHQVSPTPLTSVPGFRTAGIACGIKPNSALDLAVIVSDQACTAAAVFTQNRFPAAPVLYGRQLISTNPNAIRAVIINSGNANACTGDAGLRDAYHTAELVAAALGITARAVFVMSTGVIGVPLPMERLTTGIPQAVKALGRMPEAAQAACQAIMTTDTRPKTAGTQVRLPQSDITVTIAGMAKGAGMIHPNMATMLAVIVTDAAVTAPALQKALNTAVTVSFNSITVDGDTSTNDTVLVLANGLAGNPVIEGTDTADYRAFAEALKVVATNLAQQIVRDGEGATRFVTIRVEGAANEADARRAAKAVAHSPLVKTALYGGDANWGRVLAAVGYSGAEVDPVRTELWFAGGQDGQRGKPLQVVAGGQPTDYAESEASAIFAQPEIDILIRLGVGQGETTVWTCDLSHEYVTINGHYRT
ncbi:MAG TPA: bifunctional glutamate N-acetyltransferase/amino-acid acetyltransferase ArgJ [Anaerolineae bacterium]|nr:bifunctional glutamate N-acetyltransferase/amino-acid acetyltransferase ArgJ [Anaerolineae bacterium]HIQ05080.1 bifunctional glutamate N-acetyltransferase/amino-acid acetyltransferase ArgJ [Anaerolineae bacterium]